MEGITFTRWRSRATRWTYSPFLRRHSNNPADRAFAAITLFGFGLVAAPVEENTAADAPILGKRPASLPDTTAVYCAHEYTRANSGLARSWYNNQCTGRVEQQCEQARAEHRQQLRHPAQEKRLNPCSCV